VTRVWRAAIDAAKQDAAHYVAKEDWMTQLGKLSEGRQHTLGAYYRPWK
jgi:putative protease